MTELEFLDRQEDLVTKKIKRAALGSDGEESPVELLERGVDEHPFLAVGGATLAVGLLGFVMANAPAKVFVNVARVVAKPSVRSLGRLFVA